MRKKENENTNHRVGKKKCLQKIHLIKDGYLKYTKNTKNSAIKKKKKQSNFFNGPNILIDASSEKIIKHMERCATSYVIIFIIQSSLMPCNPMDSSSPDSSVHGILQARILAWVAMPFSRESSQPRDRTQVSCIAGRFFTV